MVQTEIRIEIGRHICEINSIEDREVGYVITDKRASEASKTLSGLIN